MNHINGISLFSSAGIDEYFLHKNNIFIKVSNELIPQRAKFYSHLYSEVNMLCGDITSKTIFNNLVKLYKKYNCKFLLATPPCQGMSIAGQMKKDDPRNFLIINLINFIRETKPEFILIENVPTMLKFSINLNGAEVKIADYILSNLQPLGYCVNYSVLDAADYNTPQFRKRAIFLISKNKKWEIPKKKKQITVRESIGDLPSLESGEASDIQYHYSKTHNKDHILWMKNTPTGKSAFENPIYFPNVNGRKIKGYKTTYKRISWDEPAPTITMSNGAISSQNNVHPGRKLKDGTYSDARVLTILELLRLTGLPDDWDIPFWASESLIRKIIGEGLPPKFLENLIETMPRF